VPSAPTGPGEDNAGRRSGTRHTSSRARRSAAVSPARPTTTPSAVRLANVALLATSNVAKVPAMPATSADRESYRPYCLPISPSPAVSTATVSAGLGTRPGSSPISDDATVSTASAITSPLRLLAV
jgi:hypothetical protein